MKSGEESDYVAFEQQKFKEPDNTFRSVPFYSLNDSLSEEELVRQLKLMKEGGFGGAFFYICESYATGRPVVEPHRGSFPEIVGDGGILYEDESAAGLAKALEKILSNKALYDKKREAAQKMAEQRYSDEVCAKALVELYEKVIK